MAQKGKKLRVFAADGVLRFFIPNGTVIPARGHYLGANSSGYSLSNYPAGNSTTALPDATWSTDIPDNSGIALFTSTNAPVLGNRLDAVGSTNVGNTLFREGPGLPPLVAFSINYSFVRRVPILGGNAGLPEIDEPLFRCPGLKRFSGPGAPSRCPPPALVPFVSTNLKSTALSFVSCGTPAPTPLVGIVRNQL